METLVYRFTHLIYPFICVSYFLSELKSKKIEFDGLEDAEIDAIPYSDKLREKQRKVVSKL